eukprot:scaffold154523_cov35-Prasinocladus_malaysianus.AAC.1
MTDIQAQACKLGYLTVDLLACLVPPLLALVIRPLFIMAWKHRDPLSAVSLEFQHVCDLNALRLEESNAVKGPPQDQQLQDRVQLLEQSLQTMMMQQQQQQNQQSDQRDSDRSQRDTASIIPRDISRRATFSSEGAAEGSIVGSSSTLGQRAEQWAKQRSRSTVSDRSWGPPADGIRPPVHNSRGSRSLPDTSMETNRDGAAASHDDKDGNSNAPIPPKPRSGSLRRPTSAASAPATHVGSLPWRAQAREQAQQGKAGPSVPRIYSAGPTRPAHQQRTVLLN